MESIAFFRIFWDIFALKKFSFSTVLNSEVRKGADIVLACDGAYSAMRKSLQNKIPLFDLEQKYIEHGYLEFCMFPTADNDVSKLAQ